MLIFGIGLWGERAAVEVAQELWWADVAMSLVCGVAIPFMMFTRQRHAIDQMTAVWLLPVVAAEVAAASGGLLAPHLGASADFAVLVTSYVLWAYSVPIALSILVIPLAYAVILPALYLPVILMLGALILRGVAFEFRVRGRARGKRIWTVAFTVGSLLATVAQGFVLGGFVQGFAVRDGQFVGGAFAWLTPYTGLVAAGLVAGYALLGAGWLVFKTQDELHGDARRWTARAATVTGPVLALVSLATVWVHPAVAARWGVSTAGLDLGRFLPLSAAPLLGAAGLAVVALGVRAKSYRWPFVGATLVFVSGFLGLAASFAPYVAPPAYTFRQAAAADNALGLMLAGASVLLPMILGYTAFTYWTFRGKVTPDAGYH